jgi:hypothetical protein
MLFAQLNPKDRWKETKRTDRKNVVVTFKDTMQITGVTKDSLKIRRGAFLYPGAITNDLLDMGYDQYQIIKLNASEIKIGDQDYIHIFSKEAIDTSNNSIARSMQNMAAPLKQVNSIDTTVLKGSWQAYSKKKKDAANTSPINYKTMITKLTFSGRNAQNNYGSVSTGSGDSYTIDGVSGGNISLKDNTGKLSKLIVYKANKEELIVEDASGLLYYMKQF